jgi:NAD(P)-dependent dehydrogenase (short-subunit alcohol dehydrogenase family)
MMVTHAPPSDRPVALITGATGGLGQVMTAALLGDGIRVVASARTQPALDALLDGVMPSKAVAVVAELDSSGARTQLVERARAAFGRIDVIVNNAALVPGHLWEDWDVTGEPAPWTLDDALHRRFLEINTVAPHALASAFLPEMIDRGWGRIVNVTTSLSSMLQLWPYGASKAALEAATATLATRLEGTGVTANALLPGGYASPEPRRSATGEIVHDALPPSIMAAPLRWLTSRASDGVTGRRILAVRWDPELPPDQLAPDAVFPVAWTGYGPQTVFPPTPQVGSPE